MLKELSKYAQIVCARLCRGVCGRAHACVCLWVWLCVCVCVWERERVSVCVFLCVRVCSCLCVCICGCAYLWVRLVACACACVCMIISIKPRLNCHWLKCYTEIFCVVQDFGFFIAFLYFLFLQTSCISQMSDYWAHNEFTSFSICLFDVVKIR